MNLKERFHELTVEELSYVAGFFDGEGTTGIYSGSIIAAVCNTDRTVLDWLKESFGGSILMHKPKPPRKPLYRWTVAAWDAFDFLLTIQPYVRMKVDRIDVALEFQRTIKRGSGPNHYSTDEQDYRELLCELMRSFNRRGNAQPIG